MTWQTEGVPDIPRSEGEVELVPIVRVDQGGHWTLHHGDDQLTDGVIAVTPLAWRMEPDPYTVEEGKERMLLPCWLEMASYIGWAILLLKGRGLRVGRQLAAHGAQHGYGTWRAELKTVEVTTRGGMSWVEASLDRFSDAIAVLPAEGRPADFPGAPALPEPVSGDAVICPECGGEHVPVLGSVPVHADQTGSRCRGSGIVMTS